MGASRLSLSLVWSDKDCEKTHCSKMLDKTRKLEIKGSELIWCIDLTCSDLSWWKQSKSTFTSCSVQLTNDDLQRLIDLQNVMQKQIIGQPEATGPVCNAMKRAHMGFRDMNRPAASFIFCGPTGVGKTETAKILASQYFQNKEALIRLDMSEYQDWHEVSKLFGAPPGRPKTLFPLVPDHSQSYLQIFI